MTGFTIEYNRLTADYYLTEFSGIDGHREALQYRLERESKHPSGDWEVVSLNSDSLETIRKTHSRYFTGRQL